MQDLDSNTNMRATFLAGGKAIERGVVDDVRSIDLAPTAAFLLDIPAPQHSQGVVRRDLLDDGRKYKPLSIVGLNDFHGQLDPAALTLDGRTLNGAVGGAAHLATMFDEEASHLPGRTLLLAAGDNVGASPPSSALLQDMPAIDVENAWGLDATSPATTSSTSGSSACSPTRRGRTSRSWRPTWSRGHGRHARLARAHTCSASTASVWGSSARSCATRPSSSSRPTRRASSSSTRPSGSSVSRILLRRKGVVSVIHEGAVAGPTASTATRRRRGRARS